MRGGGGNNGTHFAPPVVDNVVNIRQGIKTSSCEESATAAWVPFFAPFFNFFRNSIKDKKNCKNV